MNNFFLFKNTLYNGFVFLCIGMVINGCESYVSVKNTVDESYDVHEYHALTLPPDYDAMPNPDHAHKPKPNPDHALKPKIIPIIPQKIEMTPPPVVAPAPSPVVIPAPMVTPVIETLPPKPVAKQMKPIIQTKPAEPIQNHVKRAMIHESAPTNQKPIIQKPTVIEQSMIQHSHPAPLDVLEIPQPLNVPVIPKPREPINTPTPNVTINNQPVEILDDGPSFHEDEQALLNQIQ